MQIEKIACLKAFDKVPHRRLFYKLDYYGIRVSTHKWISSWLCELSQKVELGDQIQSRSYLVSPKDDSLPSSVVSSKTPGEFKALI